MKKQVKVQRLKFPLLQEHTINTKVKDILVKKSKLYIF